MDVTEATEERQDIWDDAGKEKLPPKSENKRNVLYD